MRSYMLSDDEIKCVEDLRVLTAAQRIEYLKTLAYIASKRRVRSVPKPPPAQAQSK